MSKSTFTPGQSVVHDATGERGTLISTNGYSAVVEWDSTGGKNPADILPLADLALSLVNEQYAIGIPAKTAQYVIEALQEVALSQEAQDAVRDFQENYGARTLDDIERTAAHLGIDLLAFAKLILKPKDERAAAVKYLHAHPELATPQTMFRDLCRAADEAGLPLPAMAEAHGIVTGTAK